MKVVIQVENGVVCDVITDTDELQEVTIINRFVSATDISATHITDHSEVSKLKTHVKEYTQSILDYVKYIRNHGFGMKHGKELKRWL